MNRNDQNSVDDIIDKAKKGEDDLPGNKEYSGSESKVSSNKIIDRLDDVTVQSEVEASKVIDIIDEIKMRLNKAELFSKELKELINVNKGNDNKPVELLNKIVSIIKEIQEMLFSAMDQLQYQDILRQKIEKIAASLGKFYDYLGEFLGRGDDRTVGKRVEDSTLVKDQKLDEIKDIIKDVNKS
jgi:hypothetical protein